MSAIECEPTAAVEHDTGQCTLLKCLLMDSLSAPDELPLITDYDDYNQCLLMDFLSAPDELACTGKCLRTEGETMPMLMLIPRLNPFQKDLLDRVFSPAPPPPPPPPPGTPVVSGWWFRLSGAPGSFAMIGLGDIVRMPSLIATDYDEWARRHCTHAFEQPLFHMR